MIRLFLSLTIFALSITATEARQRTTYAHPRCNIDWPCEGVTVHPRGERVVRAMGGFGTARKVYKPRVAKVDYKHVVRPKKKPLPMITVVRAPIEAVVRTVTGIVAPLAAKVSEIQTACGSRVVSAVRHTRVAGTRVMSLHASGQAVDMAGNPSCIYSALHGWAGGYSTDYSRVAHVHISWGGREHGVRFAHGGHRHVRRYARHRHVRYAAAR